MGQKIETLPLEVRILFEIISGIEQQRPFDQEVVPQETEGLTDLKCADPRNERQCPAKQRQPPSQAGKYFFHALRIPLSQRRGRVNLHDLEFMIS